MAIYTVRQLADMAGVSVRTLHHYDRIQLLAPSARTAAGYRLYGEKDLLRLQQILFFKELDFRLSEIRNILDNPNFNALEALHNHRRSLQNQVERLAHLLKTIDKTIFRLTEEPMTMTDEELYEGFTKEQAERYKREVRERYNPELVQESERRLGKMSKAEFALLKAEGETVTRLIAAAMGKPPHNPEVQQLVARHYAMIEQFYPVSAELYRGLGQLYTENDEFRQHYDQYRPGLADFMQAAMTYFADHVLG